MTKGTYILAPHVALRSWERVPHACVLRGQARPWPLTTEEFSAALRCDGNTPLETSPGLSSLLRRGLAIPCKAGEAKLAPWQLYRRYQNRVMPWIGLEITARCNYNCIHCFNASDNERLHAQMSLAQVERLLDEARDMGVQAVLLTGGEPLMHPQFMAVVEAVYARDMFVFELNTNGRFLTKELLDSLASIDPGIAIKISFDGLGFHDWMRGCRGAEDDALRAIGLSVARGSATTVQTNVNRKNRDSVPPTLALLDQMGVRRTRVIPTTPSARWEMNAHGQCMDWVEYLAAFLQIAAGYAKGEHSMELNGWQIATLIPQKRVYSFDVLRYSPRTFKESRPACRQINGMPGIAADGSLYPCLQCSGWYSAHGVGFGNALDEGLSCALGNGLYCRYAHATVADRLAQLEDAGAKGGPGRSCADCRWLAWCTGGCPALGALTHEGDMLMPDPCACEFFFGGWLQRYADALSSWNCTDELPRLA